MKDARKTAITILENAKAAIKLKLESLEKAENVDKIVGYDKTGSSVHEKRLKTAIKAHNEGKETPTANEHWNEAHKLGDHQHRGIVSLVASSKHGIGGGKKKVSLQDIKDHWPMHFNSHYGDKKEESTNKDLEKAQAPGKNTAQVNEFKGIPQPPTPAGTAKPIAKTPILPKLKMPSMGKTEKPLQSFMAKREGKKGKV